MSKAAVAAAAMMAATLLPASVIALTTGDVERVVCCDRKVVRVRGRCVRIYCVARPRGCEKDFGLSVQ